MAGSYAREERIPNAFTTIKSYACLLFAFGVCRLEQFGLELDSDRALNLRDGLVSRIMKVAKRLLFVDGTTYGLLVSALAEVSVL